MKCYFCGGETENEFCEKCLAEANAKIEAAISPCLKECRGRSAECHGKCDLYQRFTVKNAENREKRYKDSIINHYTDSHEKFLRQVISDKLKGFNHSPH